MSVLLIFVKKYWMGLVVLAGAVALFVFVNGYLNDRDADNQNIGFDDAVTKTNEATDKLKSEVKGDVEKNNADVDGLDSDGVNDELFPEQEGDKSESGDSSGGGVPEGYGLGVVASDAARSEVDQANEFGAKEGVIEEPQELEEFDGQMQTAEVSSEETGVIVDNDACSDEAKSLLKLAYPEVVDFVCEYNDKGEAVMLQAVFE